MYVRATLLRHAGRRAPEHAAVRQVEGEFQVVSRNGSLVAELRAPMSMNGPPRPTLHDVRLRGVSQYGMFLRGYEQAGDAAVLQEWRCEILHVRGVDSNGRPIMGG